MTDVLERVAELDFEGVGPSPTPTPARRQRIKSLFEKLGGAMTTRDIARACLNEGIWNETDREVILLRSAQAQVREALSDDDDTGLPFAGQTIEREHDGGPRVWKTRRMWDFPDYELNVNIRVLQVGKLEHTVSLLRIECADRYGREPEIVVDAVAEGEDA